MKKILVTGAAGFIGSNLSKKLEEDKNNTLILLDNFSRGKQRYLDYLRVNTDCLFANLQHNDGYYDLFKDVDTVYHTASRIGGNQFLHGSSKNELTALQDNILIDRNVFNACAKHNVKKIIYTSSVSVYNTKHQETSEVPFNEFELDFDKDMNRNLIDPEGGYGWAKFIGEKQLNYLKQMGIKVGIARIFKSYGPCDDYSENSGQVVCSLMRKAINYPKERYVMWGDGSVKRCLVYIDDLLDGLLKLENHIDKESLTVNLGGNEPYQIRYLATKVLEVSGKKMEIENDMSKPVGVKVRTPVLTLAKEKLNWEPKTPLIEGLKKTYKWMEHDLQR